MITAATAASQKIAIFLREEEKLSYKQIAERLGIPEGTVKSRISRYRAERKAAAPQPTVADASHV